jgi:hypothetical protein
MISLKMIQNLYFKHLETSSIFQEKNIGNCKIKYADIFSNSISNLLFYFILFY